MFLVPENKMYNRCGTGYLQVDMFLPSRFRFQESNLRVVRSTSGDGKYSEVVRNRWTPETAATATYPRLTTTSGDNNFRTSDFWMYKNDRFNLTQVQLTYNMPKEVLRGSFVKGLSFFVNANNLLTIAKERKALELNVGSTPQTRFYQLGLKGTF